MSEKSKTKKYTKMHNKKFAEQYRRFTLGIQAWMLYGKAMRIDYMKAFNKLFASQKNCPDWIKSDWFIRTGAGSIDNNTE